MYFVYILACSDNTLYVGLTKNIKNRFLQHQTGESRSTKFRRPVTLKFVSIFYNRNLAAEFEQYLKTSSGRAFLRKRLVKQKVSFVQNRNEDLV